MPCGLSCFVVTKPKGRPRDPDGKKRQTNARSAVAAQRTPSQQDNPLNLEMQTTRWEYAMRDALKAYDIGKHKLSLSVTQEFDFRFFTNSTNEAWTSYSQQLLPVEVKIIEVDLTAHFSSRYEPVYSTGRINSHGELTSWLHDYFSTLLPLLESIHSNHNVFLSLTGVKLAIVPRWLYMVNPMLHVRILGHMGNLSMALRQEKGYHFDVNSM